MPRALLGSAAVKPLLATLLEEPELLGLVRSLEPGVLGTLIHHIGLEDSGELVALASSEQLGAIFDEDLWQSAEPGSDAQFDPERFGLWLDVMLQNGEAFAARQLTELDEDLVVLGLSRLVGVVESERLAAARWHSRDARGDTRLTRALDSHLYHEFEEYLVYSRAEHSWSAVLALFVELDASHHDRLQTWLGRCCDLAEESDPEDAGYYDVLTPAATLSGDVAAAREERRERQGFVAPSDAAAFLSAARSNSLVEILSARTHDPLTQAYFRQYFAALETPAPAAARAQPAAGGEPAVAPAHGPGVERLLAAMRAAEVVPEAAPGGLLGAGTPARTAAELLVRAALLELKTRDAALYGRRLWELGYLANVLLAGATWQGRALRPVEAGEASVAFCNLGLERALGPDALLGSPASRTAQALKWLTRHDLVMAFRAGIHVLFAEVALPAAERLASLLERYGAATSEPDERRALGRITDALRADARAGKPWRSRSRLVRLAVHLNPETAAVFGGLLDECPTLAPTLRASADSAPRLAMPFIADLAQVQSVSSFLHALGDAEAIGLRQATPTPAHAAATRTPPAATRNRGAQRRSSAKRTRS